MDFIKELFKSYRDHDLAGLSANISYFAILSFIPLLMIMTSIVGFVLGSSQSLFNAIVSSINDVVPGAGSQLAENLTGVVDRRSQLGGIGVVFLIFISTLLFSSIERSLDKIFQSVKSRNFFHSKLVAILFLCGIALMFFLPTMVNIFQTVLLKFNVNIPLGEIATSRPFFIIVSIVSFVAAVVVIPNHTVKFKYAAVGGVLFAAGLYAARFIFRWYIVHSFDRYNLIYGSLTVLVVGVIWIYYLANILLVSSEVVAILQRRYSPWLNNGTSGNRD